MATVSYVLNNGPRYSSENHRAQVLEAVERLGYHPNALARGLAGRRVNTIGVLFSSLAEIVTNPYVSAVLQGVFAQSTKLGYNVTLFTQRWESAGISSLSLQDGRCDGLLLVAPTHDTDVIPGVAALELPAVVVSAAVDAHHGLPYVDVDNRKGAQLAVEHLLSLGHRRIAHLGGDYSQPQRGRAAKRVLRSDGGGGTRSSSGFRDRVGYGKGQGIAAARCLLSDPRPPRPYLLPTTPWHSMCCGWRESSESGCRISSRSLVSTMFKRPRW